ncbi:rod shape-determining protein MreC [Bacteroidales bacterium Barb4]|nr:rod shape-determining protein MreC [Bacteroidales bacterium Barb4]
MRKLLDFLIRQRHWLVFILLITVSGVLIYRNAAYQRTVFISSANVVVGYAASVSGYANSYLNLREINTELTARNGNLEKQLLTLQQRLEHQKPDTVLNFAVPGDSAEHFPYHFVIAKVVNNSVIHLSNYITIGKGRKHGIAPGMGVISDHGVVGIISHVSDYFAVVLPILNPKHRLSCKLSRTNYFGSLVWNGRDARYAQLDELPRHVQIQEGDTIVTSGYSAIFPAGIMVGKVYNFQRHHDDNFYSAEVELSVDFSSLNDVHVIINERQEEQADLEQEAIQ